MFQGSLQVSIGTRMKPSYLLPHKRWLQFIPLMTGQVYIHGFTPKVNFGINILFIYLVYIKTNIFKEVFGPSMLSDYFCFYTCILKNDIASFGFGNTWVASFGFGNTWRCCRWSLEMVGFGKEP